MCSVNLRLGCLQDRKYVHCINLNYILFLCAEWISTYNVAPSCVQGILGITIDVMKQVFYAETNH